MEIETRKKLEEERNKEVLEQGREVDALRERFELKVAQIKAETQSELSVIEMHMREECERAKQQTQTVQMQCSQRESEYQKAH